LRHDFRIINIKFFCLFLLIILPAFTNVNAQWISNPEKNTLLVTNCFNPVNISAVEDSRGGMFLFWEDNISGFQGDVSFLHVNGDGIVSFRSDGRKVSSSETPKYKPVSITGPPGSAYVVWRERVRSYSDQLFAQKVSASGGLIWKANGIPISSHGMVISDFASASDRSSNLFTIYVNGESDKKGEYSIRLQGINQNGVNLFPDEIIVAHSDNKKSNLSLVSDGKEGIHVFWLESINHKSVIYGQSIDYSGKLRWGNKPLSFTNPKEDVFSFNIDKFSSSVHLVWQMQKTSKDIYHQLISNEGKQLWQKYGVQVLPGKGNQTNPQSLISGNNIMITWTDDSSGDRNILIQRYNSKGEVLWKKDGVNVINLKGDQFGQKILSDGLNGAIITWLDRRNASRGNIYAQRINADGRILWDSLGIQTASNNNSEKSYISVIPDNTGGVIVLFKEKRNGKNEIFGQKIFNTGTFTSQIIAFNTELEGDSVRISWYSANEVSPSNFTVERTLSEEEVWQKVGEIRSDGKASAKYYEFYDRPDKTGTIFYRVIHYDHNGNIQPSDLAKINYFSEEASVYISQNSPNPFKDKTKINIYLPESENVSIEFFDSRIEKISEIKKQLSAGMSEVEFSASGLTPGIYFYKVIIGDFIEVKKMVVAN
jgi:hypothetical protein